MSMQNKYDVNISSLLLLMFWTVANRYAVNYVIGNRVEKVVGLRNLDFYPDFHLCNVRQLVPD